MKINHITVLVKDNMKALDFYVEKLGCESLIIKEKHCWAKVGEVWIHLAQNSGFAPKNSFQHFAISVENLPDYIKNLKNKGVKVEIDGMQYFIRDLDDNLIELIDEDNQFFKTG